MNNSIPSRLGRMSFWHRPKPFLYFIKIQKFLLLLLLLLASLNGLHAQRVDMVDTSASSQLYDVIRAGNVNQLAALLQKGVHANATVNGYSALMLASLNGTLDEMKLLFEKGADINYVNGDSISALWLAEPDPAKTKWLKDHGANVQQRPPDGNNLLVKLAQIPGSTSLMKLLIDKGCDVKKSGPVNNIMYNAASTDDTAMVGLLIQHGISVNDTCFIGDNPLNSALGYRCFHTLKMLVDHGADVNASPKSGILPLFAGITPLMWAAVGNDKPSFYYLLQHGADAKAKSPRGYTTLMFLAMSEEDDPRMTQALIDHGALPSEKAKDGTDALYYARLKGNTESVTLLSKSLLK